MQIEGLGEVRASEPERVILRMRGAAVTVSGWRIAVESPRGPGTIVLAEQGGQKFYRGEACSWAGRRSGWRPPTARCCRRRKAPATTTCSSGRRPAPNESIRQRVGYAGVPGEDAEAVAQDVVHERGLDPQARQHLRDGEVPLHSEREAHLGACAAADGRSEEHTS